MLVSPLPVASAYPPWADAALFEVSWEVCNQVGGIHQVLRSKAAVMKQRWDDRYLLLGPHIPAQAALEFEPEPVRDWVADLLAELTGAGLGAVHGRWLVPGRPRVLLLDHQLPADRLAALRRELASEHGIPPTQTGQLIDDVLGFGHVVYRVLAAAARRTRDAAARERGGPHRLVAQFHEWLGGLALPLLRREQLPVATIFTTHATSVGRFVASSEADFYERLPYLDSVVEAERFGIATQHAIEAQCARRSHVFTTVSPITGEECELLLGRAPDIITPNGLNIDRYDVGHDFQTYHAQYKEQIHRFVMGHFFPSYSFDLDRTLYFFSAGRFEPRNKGFDLCLETMARLNTELRTAGAEVTVVFFIVTARATRSLDPHGLQFRGVLDELLEVSRRIGADVAERLFRRSAAGERVGLDDLVDEYWRLRHRRIQHAFRTERLPPLVTHVLEDETTDPIMAHLRTLGLRNQADDPVKVVYHPEFISPVSPLWGMDYEHFVRGCHLGIFPSSYEPWGYTPLECLAMGVPAITSDLAGFGRYVSASFPDHDDWGLVVMPRRGRSFHDAAADLTRRLMRFCRFDRRGRISQRNLVEVHSRAFDWSRLASAYHEAHDQGLAAVAPAGA
jgi:glycogen(starch) synthase